jgi:hypothetical protein
MNNLERDDTYLCIDWFIKLQIDFINSTSLTLNSLHAHSRVGQFNFGMLQVNCHYRQINNVFVFICLAGSLGPENYKRSMLVSTIANDKGMAVRMSTSTFRMKRLYHFVGRLEGLVEELIEVELI